MRHRVAGNHRPRSSPRPTAGENAESSPLHLHDGSRVGIVGAGPAGSLFAYFLLASAKLAKRKIDVDIFEARDFTRPGPRGCNMCGGIVSESLVQLLAAEGINLPPTVVQRGIDAYVLHMDIGSVRLGTPLREKRIAALYRGPGPRGGGTSRWQSLDGYLLKLATDRGARLIPERVQKVTRHAGRPEVATRGGGRQTYDFLTLAVGVNAAAHRILQDLSLDYHPPRTTKAYICEYHLGAEVITAMFGSAMHVFLLDLPRLEFAAIIPKGDCATVVLLGTDIDRELIGSFLEAPEVRRCFPPGWDPENVACRCSPRMNVGGAVHPFADRILFLGDCGVTRLNKDGIGAAYRMAKVAASTAVFEGISTEAFRRHYAPACRSMSFDNAIGKLIFFLTRTLRGHRTARLAIRHVVMREQSCRGQRRHLSRALWDLFTGSAGYRDVLLRILRPPVLWNLARAVASRTPPSIDHATETETAMKSSGLGKIYGDGETIMRQGDVGDCMYVIQEGEVEVSVDQDGVETALARLGSGELFGEMAICDREVRSATIRARGRTRILTIDQGSFLRRVHEDPSLALNVVQTMARRIRRLNQEVAALRARSDST